MIDAGDFLANVEVDDRGCWLWTGRLNRGGYGLHYTSDHEVLAHRLAYTYMVRPIPFRYAIDHMCRVRNCVNPEHLDAVTIAENNRRMRRDRAAMA